MTAELTIDGQLLTVTSHEFNMTVQMIWVKKHHCCEPIIRHIFLSPLWFKKTVLKGIFFSKLQAADLFIEIRNQFIQGLDDQEWMDNETRNQARIKVRYRE